MAGAREVNLPGSRSTNLGGPRPSSRCREPSGPGFAQGDDTAVGGCDELEDPILAVGNAYRADLYGPAPEFSAVGSADSNMVLGSDFDNQIFGLAGDDWISAGAGIDFIE